MRTTGEYQRTAAGGESVEAFVPFALPPRDPELEWTAERREALCRAESSLEHLELAGGLVPSLDWFLYAFVRKEAVLSSQIEGTQATLVDLFTFEASGRDEPPADTDLDEVCNHLDALAYARGELRRASGPPLSMRLLNGAHRRLLKGRSGSGKAPGELRRSQNWIGGTRPGNAAFVPPPPDRLPRLTKELEEFLHTETELAPLVRVGLAHAQFETIHPYLDGNGRIGRLLITLLLEHHDLLSEPLLYLSLWFKRHRAEYYRRLDAIRTEGDWEGWIDFFLEGVTVIAEETAATARELFHLVHADRARVLEASNTSVNALRLLELLPEHPIVSAASTERLLGTSRPTAASAIRALVELGILAERTGRARDQVYGYEAYLDRLRAD